MSSSENQFSSPPGYDVDEATPESHPPAISSATNLPASDHTAVTPPAQAASPLPHATSEPARPVEQDPAAPALPERPAEEEFPDPQIASLHAIFPDFDASLLQTVLESVGGDQDRAVDTLLGMSDPDHVPTAAPTQPVVMTQTELDEEFARQLMLEDEQRYQQRESPLAYTPRSRTSHPVQSEQTPASPPKDTMADVQEQFSKIAESGKRTFSSIVSKVKAKVQEFDQSRNAQSSSSTTGTQPSWGATTGGQPGLDRHAQQAYYAPRASYDTPAQGYDTYSNVASSRNTAPSPAGASSPASRPLSPPSDPATGTPPPPSTGSGRPNIDPGKIGLLPKRPVSLLNTTDAQPSGRLPDDDDSDELEYVENPFEEGKRI